MELPQTPSFGQAQNPNPYTIPSAGTNNRTKWLLIGGGVLIVVLFFVVFSSGGSTKGQPEMKQSLQSSSDALGVLDEYLDDVTVSSLKNDLALSQILLRGNYQRLNELYSKTFPKAKKFSNSPKIDDASEETLDRAKRNNVLDSEIITVLRRKIGTTYQALQKTKPFFSKPSSKSVLNDTEEDLKAVDAILDKSDLI